MLKAGIIGLGAMGRGHLDNYVRLEKENNTDIKLVAICDIRPERFKNSESTLNIKGVGAMQYDFDKYHLYTDMDEMIEKEQLDLVTIALPTYLHCEATVKCLNKGINVLCEKPMALNPDQCQLMIDAAKKNGKKLMIGQCLRFWGNYVYLKNAVESGEFGRPVSGYFFRGGSTPSSSYNNWLQKKECGGGAIFDQHVHDVDMVQYLFGMPEAVCSVANVVIPGSNFDAVSTNYLYPDGKAVNSQNDWTISGFGFDFAFRVNFTGGSIMFDTSNGMRVAKKDGEFFVPDFDQETGYFNELLYLADCIINNKENTINPPESSKKTVELVLKEIESAANGGAVTKI